MTSIDDSHCVLPSLPVVGTAVTQVSKTQAQNLDEIYIYISGSGVWTGLVYNKT